MTETEIDEMGPIDYIIIEWPNVPDAGLAEHLQELVDRGIIRVLDVAFIAKNDDGSVEVIESHAEAEGLMGELDGASSGLLADEDIAEAANALEPGASAAVLVWENRWAAPFAVAVRKSGGQLVASGRIPVQALIAALDAVEAAA